MQLHMQKETKNEIDIHLEHLPEDVLKGIAEKAENKIGNYDTVEIYPDAPIQEILSGDKNGKDYHQELFEKLIAILENFAVRIMQRNSLKNDAFTQLMMYWIV